MKNLGEFLTQKSEMKSFRGAKNSDFWCANIIKNFMCRSRCKLRQDSGTVARSFVKVASTLLSELFNSQAHLGRSSAVFDVGSFALHVAPRSRWPLAMQLELPTAWPTARMRKREQILSRETWCIFFLGGFAGIS